MTFNDSDNGTHKAGRLRMRHLAALLLYVCLRDSAKQISRVSKQMGEVALRTSCAIFLSRHLFIECLYLGKVSIIHNVKKA